MVCLTVERTGALPWLRRKQSAEWGGERGVKREEEERVEWSNMEELGKGTYTKSLTHV